MIRLTVKKTNPDEYDISFHLDVTWNKVFKLFRRKDTKPHVAGYTGPKGTTQKIHAIKELREISGWGLVDAKKAIERWENTGKPQPFEYMHGGERVELKYLKVKFK